MNRGKEDPNKELDTITFKEWIDMYRGKDTPRGDLAFDIAKDKEFPKENSREIILRYLKRKKACSEAKETFRRAWKSYEVLISK